METMAWGMVVTGLTLFGMLALWVIADSLNGSLPHISLREETPVAPASAPEIVAIKRAA